MKTLTMLTIIAIMSYVAATAAHSVKANVQGMVDSHNKAIQAELASME